MPKPKVEIHTIQISSPEELDSIFELLTGEATKQDHITDEERQLSFSYLARVQSAKDIAELDRIGHEIMGIAYKPHNRLLPERQAHYDALTQAVIGVCVMKFGLEALKAYRDQMEAKGHA